MQKTTEPYTNKPLHPSATSFTELALRYNPRMSAKSARRILHEWIKTNHSLKEELSMLAWTTTARILTPRQVKAIYERLGEP